MSSLVTHDAWIQLSVEAKGQPTVYATRVPIEDGDIPDAIKRAGDKLIYTMTSSALRQVRESA